MTVQSTDRKAGPFFSGTVLPFEFKVFSKEDIQVIWTSSAGVESTLVLDSEYSVALNPDQDNTPGGSVTLNTAISGGANTVIIGDLEYNQGTDIRNQSGFEPEIVEDALDRVTILVQQLLEMAKRTLRIPASSSSTISTQLPQPTASNVLGWNGEANQLINLTPQDIATTVAFGTAFVDQFEGNGVQTEFSLSANPALLANMDVQVGGVSLRNGIDFVLLAGAVIKFTTPPAAPGVPGSPNIQIRGTVAVPQGFDTADVVVTQLPESGLWTTVQGFINRSVSGMGASIVGYTPAGTGAVTATVQDKLRETVSVKDFGAACDWNGTTGIDDSAAVQLAINYCLVNNKDLLVPGLCLLGASVNIDRLVDGALNDNYFTISSFSGGGFVVASDTTMFSTTLINSFDPNLPVSQLIKFVGLKFESDVNTRVAYVLDQNKFLRIIFESCNFRKIKCLDAPAGKLTQTITFQNCQARRWSGTFFVSKEATFDLKVLGGLWEAGGNGFDIDFPVGTAFLGANIEGMAVFAIKYIGGYGLTIDGNYFEENGNNDVNGCSVDGSLGVGLDGSETVQITGNYFSGDTDTPSKPQVKWGDCIVGKSGGNLCTTTLHNLGVNSRVSGIKDDYARTLVSNNEPLEYFRAKENQSFGGVITQKFVSGVGGFLQLRSLQNNTPSANGIDINDSGDVISTGQLRQRPIAAISPSVNGEFVLEATNNTTLTFKFRGTDGIVRTAIIAIS